MGMILPGKEANSSAVAWRFSSLRLAMTTLAPASDKRRVMALPMPRPPPVTRATLPWRLRFVFTRWIQTSSNRGVRVSRACVAHFLFPIVVMDLFFECEIKGGHGSISNPQLGTRPFAELCEIETEYNRGVAVEISMCEQLMKDSP